MAPVDRRAQGALAVGRVARAAPEDVERACEPGVQLARASRSVVRAAASSMASGRPSRRRQISATAPALPVGQLEASVVAAGALDEQRAGRGLRDGGRVGVRWDRQRGDGVAVLGLRVAAAHGWSPARRAPERRPAGRRSAGAAGRRCSKLSSTSSPRFEARKRSTATLEGLALQRCDAHGLRDRARDMLGARGRGERDEPSRRRGTRARARARPPAPAASCPPRPGRSARPAGPRYGAAARETASRSCSRPSVRVGGTGSRLAGTSAVFTAGVRARDPAPGSPARARASAPPARSPAHRPGSCARPGRPAGRPPGVRSGKGRASAARGGARGRGARRSAPRAARPARHGVRARAWPR